MALYYDDSARRLPLLFYPTPGECLNFLKFILQSEEWVPTDPFTMSQCQKVLFSTSLISLKSPNAIQLTPPVVLLMLPDNRTLPWALIPSYPNWIWGPNKMSFEYSIDSPSSLQRYLKLQQSSRYWSKPQVSQKSQYSSSWCVAWWPDFMLSIRWVQPPRILHCENHQGLAQCEDVKDFTSSCSSSDKISEVTWKKSTSAIGRSLIVGVEYTKVGQHMGLIADHPQLTQLLKLHANYYPFAPLHIGYPHWTSWQTVRWGPHIGCYPYLFRGKMDNL